jgi:carboxymethylenebutenolidase
MSSNVKETRKTGKAGTPVVLYEPPAAGSHACVFVMPERYGLVRHSLEIAQRIASNGYVVAVPDLMYKHPDQEQLHLGNVDCNPSDADILLMLEDSMPVVASVSGADLERIGMIGVCQSGRYPLIYAAKHPIAAAIIFYGAAHDAEWHVTDIHPCGVDGLIEQMKRTNVLGIFGEGDHVISIGDVTRFRNAIEKYNHNYQITLYPEVPHGWLNDTMPGRYRKEAAEAAWDELLTYLKAKLSPQGAAGNEVEWIFRARSAVDYDFTKKIRYE